MEDSFFSLRTAKARLRYKREYNKNYSRRDEFSWVEYKGFIPDLKLYVMYMYYLQDGFTLGQSVLLDSSWNIQYDIQSLLDGPNQAPLVSPQLQFMLSYANDATQPEGFCRFNIIKITKLNDRFQYQNYLYYQSEDWAIEDIAWIDDRSFAIKTKHQTFDEHSRSWVKQLGYIKTRLP